MARKPLHHKTKSRLKQSSALMAAVVAGVGTWEGIRLVAYKDTIGTGQPWTVCFGETRGVKPGDKYTREQCDAMLGDRLVEFEANMRACLKAPDKVPDGPYIAYLSLSYNIGSRAFCRSTVRKRADAGAYRKSCDAILAWNKARGRVVRGLTNRRKHERKTCLEGLKKTTSENTPVVKPPVKKLAWWKFWG